MCSPDWVPTVVHRLGRLDSRVGMVGRGFIYEVSIHAAPPLRTEAVGILSHLTQIFSEEFVGRSIQSLFPNRLPGRADQFALPMERLHSPEARVLIRVLLRLAQV